jgi:uncharacterized protein YndB with AHSA1/START domain
MSTKIDASGRRFVQSEAVVHGTPEQVWDAIATGPGVSSWFVPCKIEGRVGGEIVASFGPGMDSKSTVTAWNPPHSFSAEGAEMSPGAPVMATEWTVEALSGGTCRVRVVHSWFAETDEWDAQFEGTEGGWTAFFRDLELYLVHFAGQPAETIQFMAMSAESSEATWSKLEGTLGLEGKAVGDTIASDAGQTLSGRVTYLGRGEHLESLLLLDQPAPGVAHFFGIPMGDMFCISIRLFFFGEEAKTVAEGEEGRWSAWIEESFPTPLPAEG